MRIVQLKAENFRRFERLSLQLSGRLNLFVGDNAAGKTSILEMLYCAGRGRSFRAGDAAELAGPRERRWTVFAGARDAQDAKRDCGVQWTPAGVELRLDGAAATGLELIRTCPVQILEPGMYRLLSDGPTYRRSFIDWGVFHVEQAFLETWRRYRRALRQRNQLLRLRRPAAELAAWEPELAESGEQLHALRHAHLAAIGPRVAARLQAFVGEGPWSFELHAGWKAGMTLREALLQQRPRDIDTGTTGVGPHRAELRIRADARSARSRISRGQQKMLLAALLLAQCEEVAMRRGQAPVLLVDDFGAELAPRYRARLLEALVTYGGQSVLTSFEPVEELPQDSALFHVEHGNVRG